MELNMDLDFVLDVIVEVGVEKYLNFKHPYGYSMTVFWRAENFGVKIMSFAFTLGLLYTLETIMQFLQPT